MYTPADMPDKMRKAAEIGGDTIIFDLEDAVSKSKIGEARKNIEIIIENTDFGEKEVGARINGVGTDYWLEDLEAVIDAGVDVVILPMIEEPWQIRTADEVADQLNATSLEFIPLLESPMGVFSGKELAIVCRECQRISGLSFGGGDYHLAIGAPEISSRVKKFLNHLIIGFATIGDLDPIATVHTEIHDLDGQEEAAKHARELGFIGQAAIHPTQVEIINEVFTPSDQTYKNAVKYVEAFEATEKDSIMVDDVFLDTAIVKRYQDIIQRYEEIDRI